MKSFFVFLFLSVSTCLFSQKDTTTKIPFEGMELYWLNGQSRVKESPLIMKDKDGETILTGNAYADTYYNYNFSNPVDNTHTISGSIGRHNEIQVNMASIGIETNYKNIIGRINFQTGAMLNLVQDLDMSVNRGRNTGTGNLKFIREAAAGYHFNKWYGINVEAGIFTSYLGLESYMLQDNWSYQRSTNWEFAPFYFQGARLQMFLTKKIKQEIWLINGWQSYNSFSKSPSLGSSTYYRPTENIQLTANFYVGTDTQNPDTLGNQSNRIRFHHDNSISARYYKKSNSKAISQMAVSMNNHYGFQQGDGVTSKEHFLIGTSIANRIWFNKNKLALTMRGDYLINGGAYLAYSPSSVATNDFSDAYAKDPNKKLELFQGTLTFDVMPNDFVTFRFEYGYRNANLPYFVGHRGTTSASGWGTATPGWKPELQKTENRLTLCVNFRL
jgi:hypothetical protein